MTTTFLEVMPFTIAVGTSRVDRDFCVLNRVCHPEKWSPGLLERAEQVSNDVATLARALDERAWSRFAVE